METKTKRWATWGAWVGSTTQLEKIGAVIIDLLDRRADALIAKFEKENPPPSDSEEEQYLSGRYVPFAYYRGFAEDAVKSIKKGCTLQVSFTNGAGDESTGDLVEFVSAFDPRSYRDIVFQAKFSGHGFPYGELLRLAMSPVATGPGVTLEITSMDKGWANQAERQVSEEVGKGQPWWASLRSPRGRVASGVVVGLLAAITVGSIVALTDLSASIVGIIAVASGCSIGGSLVISDAKRPWLLLPVEVVSDGARPRGSNALLYIGGLVLTSILGLAVNVLSGSS